MATAGSVRFKAVAVVACIAALVAACSGGAGTDKSGGHGNVERVTLVMAAHSLVPDQLVSWAGEVGRLSEGTLSIEFESEWRQGDPQFEVGMVADVEAGMVDLAWVGARVFDKLGVNDFQALLAPLLIDSHDVQAAVFDAGIPDEMLADSADDLDVVGLGVLPGDMRKILGIRQPFLAPGDFGGAVVGIQQSGVAEQAMAALGATTQNLPAGAELDSVDGYEQQLASIAGNRYWEVADHVTANINLWPRPSVLIMNEASFEALSRDQQEALRDAAAAAIPGAQEALRAEDREGAADLCRFGMTFALASEGDLAAMRAAFESVYEALARDPTTARHLDAINAIEAELSAPPDRAECDKAAAPAGNDAGFPEGTYQATLDRDDARPGCPWAVSGELLHEVTFGDGQVVQSVIVDGARDVGFAGTYTVFRDRVELTDRAGTITARWVFDGTNLTFSDVAPTCIDEIVWGTRPWVLVPEEGPAGALDGTYQWTLRDEDALAHGTPADLTPEALEQWYPATFTVVLDDGEWTMTHTITPGRIEDEGTYGVFRDRIVFDWDDVTLECAFVVDDAGDLTLTAVEPMDPGDRFVWTTHEWTRIG